MRDVLEQLRTIHGVTAAFVAGPDGLVVSADGNVADGRRDVQAALAVAVYGTVERAVAGLDMSEPRSIRVEAGNQVLEIVGLGSGLLLVVIADHQAAGSLTSAGVRRAAMILVTRGNLIAQVS